MILRTVSAIAVVLAALPSAAQSQTEEYPNISGEVVVEVENDWTYESDDRANQNNDLLSAPVTN